MKLFSSALDTKNYLNFQKKQGKIIGFVPTMGALHRGHISLVERARAETRVVVSSIFVNPLQFNDPKDLERYPRNPDSDAEKLKVAGCDVLFSPSEDEMYPSEKLSLDTGHLRLADVPEASPDSYRDKKQEICYDLGMLDQVMEGSHRPGHFQGVCRAVKRLLDIVEPHKAYFGEKDFQQLAVVRHLVKTLGLSVEIVGCPTVREPDGLAMSSRNLLLGAQERKAAPRISEVLFESKEKRKTMSVGALKKWAKEKINSDPCLKMEYFEVVNAETLLPVNDWNEAPSLRACIAVKAGTIRLIDNIAL